MLDLRNLLKYRLNFLRLPSFPGMSQDMPNFCLISIPCGTVLKTDYADFKGSSRQEPVIGAQMRQHRASLGFRVQSRRSSWVRIPSPALLGFLIPILPKTALCSIYVPIIYTFPGHFTRILSRDFFKIPYFSGYIINPATHGYL
jgi:hypothetical protein